MWGICFLAPLVSPQPISDHHLQSPPPSSSTTLNCYVKPSALFSFLSYTTSFPRVLKGKLQLERPWCLHPKLSLLVSVLSQPAFKTSESKLPRTESLQAEGNHRSHLTPSHHSSLSLPFASLSKQMRPSFYPAFAGQSQWIFAG